MLRKGSTLRISIPFPAGYDKWRRQDARDLADKAAVAGPLVALISANALWLDRCIQPSQLMPLMPYLTGDFAGFQYTFVSSLAMLAASGLLIAAIAGEQ